jgi:hypothetical protein
MTTTSCGTWNNRVASSDATFEQGVIVALGDFVKYDVDGLVHEYREAINEALPPGVSLNGSEFYGPYYAADRDFSDYPMDEDDRLDIGAIVETVDFWELAGRYENADPEEAG